MLEEDRSSTQAASTQTTELNKDKTIESVLTKPLPQPPTELHIKSEDTDGNADISLNDSREGEDDGSNINESIDGSPQKAQKKKRKRRFSHNWSMRKRPSAPRKSKPESDSSTSEGENSDKSDKNNSDDDSITETDDSDDSDKETKLSPTERQSNTNTSTRNPQKSVRPLSGSRSRNAATKEIHQRNKRQSNSKTKESDSSDISSDEDDTNNTSHGSSKYGNDRKNANTGESDVSNENDNICCIARCLREGKFDSKLIDGPLKFKAGMKSGLLCDHHFGLYVTRMKCCIEGCNNYADSSPLCKINLKDTPNLNIKLKPNYFNNYQICYNHHMLLSNKYTMVTRSQTSLPQLSNMSTNNSNNNNPATRRYALRSSDTSKSTEKERKSYTIKRIKEESESQSEDETSDDDTENSRNTDDDDDDDDDDEDREEEEDDDDDEDNIEEKKTVQRRSESKSSRNNKRFNSIGASKPLKKADKSGRNRIENTRKRIVTRRNTHPENSDSDRDLDGKSSSEDEEKPTQRKKNDRQQKTHYNTRRLRSSDKKAEMSEDSTDDDNSSEESSDNEKTPKQRKKVSVKEEQLSDSDNSNDETSDDDNAAQSSAARRRTNRNSIRNSRSRRSYQNSSGKHTSNRNKSLKYENAKTKLDLDLSGKLCWKKGCKKPSQIIPFLKPFYVYSCKTHAEQFEKKLTQALTMKNISITNKEKDRVCGLCCRMVGMNVDYVRCSNKGCPFVFCKNCVVHLLSQKETHEPSSCPCKEFKEIQETEENWVCWVCAAEKTKREKRDREKYLLKLFTTCENTLFPLDIGYSDEEQKELPIKETTENGESQTDKKEVEARSENVLKQTQTSSQKADQNTQNRMVLRSHDRKIEKGRTKAPEDSGHQYTQHNLRSSTRKRKFYSNTDSPRRRRNRSTKSDNEEDALEEAYEDEDIEENENSSDLSEEDDEEGSKKAKINELFIAQMKRIMAEYEKKVPSQRKRSMLTPSEKIPPIKQFFTLIIKITCILNEREKGELSKINANYFDTIYDATRIICKGTSDSFSEWLTNDFNEIIPTLEDYINKLTQEKETENSSEREDPDRAKEADLEQPPPRKKPRLELPEELVKAINKLDVSTEGCLKITKKLEDASLKLYGMIKKERAKTESLKEIKTKHHQQTTVEKEVSNETMHALKRKSRDKHHEISSKMKLFDSMEKEIMASVNYYQQVNKTEADQCMIYDNEIKLINNDRFNLIFLRDFLVNYLRIHESYMKSIEMTYWTKYQEISQREIQKRVLLEQGKTQGNFTVPVFSNPINILQTNALVPKVRFVAVYNNRCASHMVPVNHFDRPERFNNAIAGVKLFERFITVIENPDEPPAYAINNAHSKEYIRELVESEKLPQTMPLPILFKCKNLRQGTEIKEGLELAPYVIKSTILSSTLSAGSVCRAIDSIRNGSAQMGFCITRSSGHGVGKVGPGMGSWMQGPGLLNNTAIGCFYAKYNMGINRVAIVDLDATHCNGTEEIFCGYNWVNVYSIHAYSASFNKYLPGTGGQNNQQFANIMNIPVKIGETGDVWLELIKNKIVPSLESFDPQLIFLSIGFNGLHNDFTGLLNLTENDYVNATKAIAEIAFKNPNIKIVSVLEGGYLPGDELMKNVSSHVRTLISMIRDDAPNAPSTLSNNQTTYATPQQQIKHDHPVKLVNSSGAYPVQMQPREYTRTQLSSNSSSSTKAIEQPFDKLRNNIVLRQKQQQELAAHQSVVNPLLQSRPSQISLAPVQRTTTTIQPLTEQQYVDLSTQQQQQQIKNTKENMQQQKQQQQNVDQQIQTMNTQQTHYLLPPLVMEDNLSSRNSSSEEIQQQIPKGKQNLQKNATNDGNEGLLSFLLINKNN